MTSQPPPTAMTQSKQPGEQRPAEPAGALRREVERQAQAEEAVRRPDDAQVGDAGREHARVVAEESEPGFGPDRGDDADRLADREGEGAAGEGDAQRAFALAGADVRADQRDHRRAESEHERDQQVLEPRAGAVAGDRVRAGVRADQGGGQRDRQRRLQRADRADAADAQDVGEERPLESRAAQLDDRAAGEDVPAPARAAVSRRRHHDRDAAAGDAQRRHGAPAEDEERRKRHQQDDADADRERRHEHVAGAADDARQRVQQPDQHVADEHDVRVRERRLERAALAAHRGIDRPAEGEEDRRRDDAQREVDEERVQHERVAHPRAGRRRARARPPTRCRRRSRRPTASASS